MEYRTDKDVNSRRAAELTGQSEKKDRMLGGCCVYAQDKNNDIILSVTGDGPIIAPILYSSPTRCQKLTAVVSRRAQSMPCEQPLNATWM